jgi:CRP-like cAMP-binding protein
MMIDMESTTHKSMIVPAGTTIFRAGDLGEMMYVVLDGIVNILVHETRIATVGPGGMIGEMALINKQPRSATARAATDCALLPVDAEEFAAMQQQMPGLTIEVLARLSERLRRATIREADRIRPVEIDIRRATPDDLPEIQQVVQAAFRVLSASEYTPQQIESVLRYAAGTDTPDLVAQGTYYVAVANDEIAGCGGWSRLDALYSGDDEDTDADKPLLDPARDAAKIRQFYVHPHWAKRGIGRRLLQTCEEAARTEGFTRLELLATLTGEPLYGAFGFKRIAPQTVTFPDGTVCPVVKMEKQIRPSAQVATRER